MALDFEPRVKPHTALWTLRVIVQNKITALLIDCMNHLIPKQARRSAGELSCVEKHCLQLKGPLLQEKKGVAVEETFDSESAVNMSRVMVE